MSKKYVRKKTESDERSFLYREQLVVLFLIITAQVDVKYNIRYAISYKTMQTEHTKREYNSMSLRSCSDVYLWPIAGLEPSSPMEELSGFPSRLVVACAGSVVGSVK